MSDELLVEMLNASKEAEHVKEVSSQPKPLSLEALLFLVHNQRVQKLEEQLRTEFQSVKDRQAKIRELHALLQAINTATDAKGNLDATTSPELMEMLKGAKEKHGIDLQADKGKWNSQERERMIESVRLTCDDYSVENDLQLQTVSRMNNERQESFQLARSVIKTLHEDKQRKAQMIAGR